MTEVRGERGPSVRAVAARSGVSIATVSRVMNGHTNVAPRTRQRVEEAVRELGTRGRADDASGPQAPTGTGAIYLRCPYVLSDYFGLIVSSIADAVKLRDRNLIIDAGEGAQQEHVLPKLPDRPGIAGALVILPPESAKQLTELRSRGFPFVVVDPRTPTPRDIAAVSAAHSAGARAVTAHLTGLGHRRIGVLAGPTNWLAGRDRLAGHVSALAEVGVLHDPALTRAGEPTTDYGHPAAAELLDRPDRPTALVAFNDKAALGALRAAAERGLRVPEDLSVTGFDDIDIAQATTPRLTTVRQPLQEMGRMAVSLLTRLLEGHPVEALHVELATELVVRESTGPVPVSSARAPG